VTNSRYLFGYTNLLALDIAPMALSYHTFSDIKFTAQSHVTAHQRDSQTVNVNHPDLVH